MALMVAILFLLIPSLLSAHEHNDDDDDTHEHKSGKGHSSHNGWGHHKYDKKCYAKKLVCPCKKHKRKCFWRKYRIPCHVFKDAGITCDFSYLNHDSNVPQTSDTNAFQHFDFGTHKILDAGVSEYNDLVTPKTLDAGTSQQDSGKSGRLDMGSLYRSDLKHPKTPSKDAGEPDIKCSCYDAGSHTSDENLELTGGGCSIANKSNVGSMLVFSIALFMIMLRKWITYIFGYFVIIFVLSIGSIAYADGLTLPIPGLRPSPSPLSYFMTESGRILSHSSLSSQLFLNYTRRPLALQRVSDGKLVASVIKGRFEMDLLLSLGLFNRIELGLGLPIMLGQQDGKLEALGRTETLRAGIGDFRLLPKVLIVENKHLALSLTVGLSFPSARTSQLLGESGGVAFTPRLAFSIYHSKFDVSMNIGWRTKSNQSIPYNSQWVTLDDELIGGLGLRIPVWHDKIDAIADLAFFVSGLDIEEKSTEFLGGFRAYLPHGFTANLAAGAGLSRGIGTPSYRLLVGIGWKYDYPQHHFKACKTVVKKIRVLVHQPVRVVRITKRFIILPSVYFATDKDTVLPQSFPTLQKVVELLKKHKWVRKVMVEGHTDHRASNNYNLYLSRRRARSVYRYLVSHGIDANRLTHIGYGEMRLVDKTNTRIGMAKNRRVEFVVIDPRY